MSDYLLISTGPKGQFTIEKNTLQECLDEGQKQLSNGQRCEVFVRHSQLVLSGVEVVKSAAQLDIEAKAAKAEAAEEVKPNLLP
jgi:hypothetical protein